MIKKLKGLQIQLRTIKKINRKLVNRIEAAGSDGNSHFVKLKDGQTFYSHDSPDYLKRLHPLLKKDIKSKVSADQINVLFDMIFRYYAHTNQRANLKEGKYLNFKNGDIIFEIGAYIGYQAMRMSEMVGENGKVVAIEAIPSNYDIMVKNISANNIKNIIPLNLAIWKEKGTISFNVDEFQKNSAVDNVVASKQKIDVPCNTIDKLVAELKLQKVDFIRIQTNGAEIEALEGMEETFQLKPKLLVAVPYKNQKEIQSLLEHKGYSTRFTGHSIFTGDY